MIVVTGQTRSGTRLDVRVARIHDEAMAHAVRTGVTARPGPRPDDHDFPSAAQVLAAGTLASRAWREQCRKAGGLVVSGVAFDAVDRVTFEPEAVRTLLTPHP